MIVDDHVMVREGLKALLARSEKVRVVVVAEDGLSALDKLKAIEVDVVLLDWMLPRLDGLETCRRIAALHSECNVVMLTNHLDDNSVRDAIRAGATSYMLKDVSLEELESCIMDAASGRSVLHPEAQQSLTNSLASSEKSPVSNLTSRELDVLIAIANGKSNKEIGLVLGLTEGTVKGYVSTVLAKTGTADRTQAALLAVRLGLTKEN